MSTGAIIAIAVVAAIILIALFVALPRLRQRSMERKRERELMERRETVATEHRQEASARVERAEAAEQRARIAEQEARRERAEAQLHEERATATDRGLADDDLMRDDGRTGDASDDERITRDDDRAETREVTREGRFTRSEEEETARRD